MNLRKSINIKYDIQDEKLINDYFSTSSHSQIIRNVFHGVLGEKSRSHIAFGPYGAGKSFISAILSGFLSKLYSNKKDVDIFINKFRIVDTEAADLFNRISKQKMKYIPVIINGYEGPFEDSLIRNLLTQVSNYIDIEHQGNEKTVKEVVHNWKENYQNTYQTFLEFLSKSGYTETFFFKNLTNDVVYTRFEHFYREITSGQNLHFDQNLDLIETFEFVSDQLLHNNFGILLVYDEFGRLLQNIEEDRLNRFMQQLQDLAELANNKCTNLSLLFIAHKPISHYFSYLEKERRQEFGKIEKRFTITNINSDNSTFINIASRIISEHRKVEIDDSTFKYHQRNLRKYRLFSNSFNETEIDELIVKGCFPMHPTSIYLLPLVSKIFGQNERSLFSYVLDSSNLGVLGMIQRNPQILITPDKLVDYFFNEATLSDDSELLEYAIFKSNFDLISTRIQIHEQQIAEAIYKFLMVWNITNSNSHYLISSDLISYSLNLRKETVELVLLSLTNINILRFNELTNSWQLINSSSFNFEDEYQKRKNILVQDKELFYTTLNKYNNNKIIYSNGHNNDFQMTRFALVHFLSEHYDYEKIKDQNSDFRILIKVDAKTTIPEEERNIILNYVELDQKIIEYVNRLSIVDYLLKDRQFMLENKNAHAELEYERNKFKRFLTPFYDSVFNHEFKTFQGVIKTTDIKDFEFALDNLTSKLYSRTILIQNDQINMFTITKQQENPTIEIIGMLLENESRNLESLFEGNKPDHLIFHSLSHADFSALSEHILEFLNSHPSGKFSKLIEIVCLPPYGIRPTLSALVVVYLIIDRWKNMMFFNNGNFIASVTAQQIYKTGLGIADFEYTFSEFDFVNSDFLTFILSEFKDVSEGVRNKSFSIKVLSALNNWYITLPIITQLGTNLSIQELEFIKLIKSAKVDPIKALGDMIKHFTTEEIHIIRNSIESSFMRFIQTFEGNLLKELNIESWSSYSKLLGSGKSKSLLFVKVAQNSKDFIIDYAKGLDSLEIQRWPLAMFEMLKNRVKEEFILSQEKNTATLISVNGINKEVNDVQLSLKANTMKRNLESLINANSKYITKSEVEKVILDLVNTYIK